MKIIHVKIIASISLLISCLLLSTSLLAQAGSLDLTFGTGGKVTTDIGGIGSACHAVLSQPDGKILMIGYSYVGTDNLFTLSRYNVDGTLDNTFGVDGVTTTDFGISTSWGNSAALQTDGKIVVAGWATDGAVSYFGLARYNSDGSIDNTFGTDGIVTTNIPGDYEWASALAIQSDGKIVVAGYVFSGLTMDFVLVRYDDEGLLDNTFDEDGIVTTDFAGEDDWGNAVAIQSDGKIIVAGFNGNWTNENFALARYNDDGSLDTDFNFDGKLTTDFGGQTDHAESMVIQGDNKIVVAGWSTNASGDDFALARYNGEGSLDNTFSADGLVRTNIGDYGDYAHAIALQPDGKIVVAGTSEIDGTFYDFSLVRYNIDGGLDAEFGLTGKVTTDFIISNDEAHAVAIQGDGKILAGGLTGDYPYYNFAMTRYNGGCDNSSFLSITGCESYTVPSGDETYTASGTYYDTVPNVAGCDSLIIINLTIDLINTSFYQSGNTLTANATGVSYQWINCDNGNLPIEGETNQSFTATTVGNYAVIISDAVCSDTSECYNISTIGIDESNSIENFISVYPNPFNDKLTISLSCNGSTLRTGEVVLYDITGNEILRHEISLAEMDFQFDLETKNLSPGIYLLQYSDGNYTENYKLVKY